MASSILRNGLQQAMRRCGQGSGVLRSSFRNNVPVIYLPARLVSSTAKKGATSAPSAMLTDEKTPYEIELERIKKDKKEPGYGFYQDDPYMDKITFHTLFFLAYSVLCCFVFPIACFTPYFKGLNRQWKFREAQWLLQKRRENGEPLINPDYAPAELIESMVPPPGDWEREWLSAQPTTRPILTGWWLQNID